MARWKWLGSAGAAVVLAGLGGGVAISAPGHAGPRSAHFDGTRFVNALPTPDPSPSDLLRMLGTSRAAWPAPDGGPQPVVRDAPPPQRVGAGELLVTFVNHATVLVQVDGLNVLTDPIWSDRCSPVQWAGPARYHAPGLAFDDLPPIDLVLISHNHYDHLDVDTLVALEAAHDPVVAAGLGNGAYLTSLGLERVVELDWGDTTTVRGIEVIGTPTRHFSGRGPFDRNQTLWLGFSIQAPSGSVYFGGDTGYGPHFAETAATWGSPRLALLPIGAYEPRWFMGPIHMDPAQAVQAHLDLGAQTSVGIHHGTFRLTSEGQRAPAEELAAARGAAGLPEDAFQVPAPGESRQLPAR